VPRIWPAHLVRLGVTRADPVQLGQGRLAIPAASRDPRETEPASA
jgi:hypothetical protein